MKYKVIVLSFCMLFTTEIVFSQTSTKDLRKPLTATESLEFIATDLQEIAKSLKKLNSDINKAYEKIARNMGFQISDDQRKIIVSFEILNKAEVRLANLRKSKIELLEKKAIVETRINNLERQLKDENINRGIALYGTTNAEDVRERKRNSLNRQIEIQKNVVFEIDNELFQLNSDLRETTYIVETIQREIFPAIKRELPKLFE